MDASPAERTPDALGGPDTVGSLGEVATLARILPHLPAGTSTLLGPGDDAAVVSAPDQRFVVTTDLMVHGPDFRLAWSRASDLAWRAAASNLSDVAAMGARPTALVVALAVPAETTVAFLEEFASTLGLACDTLAPGTGVVGGDMSVSPTMTIAITAFGDLEGRAPVRRDGAAVGDIVAAAGVLGRSNRGLERLFAEAVDDQGAPDAQVADRLRASDPDVAWHLAPRPPVGDGVLAAKAGATSMLDLSDGLALDAGRVARASHVTLDFDGSTLGGSPAEVRNALAGGEDHTLLATFPSGTALPGSFRAIGRVVEASAAGGVTVDGRALTEAGVGDASGWDPYRAWSGAAG